MAWSCDDVRPPIPCGGCGGDGDGASAILVGDAGAPADSGSSADRHEPRYDRIGDRSGEIAGTGGHAGKLIAECLGCGVASDELLDRWRLPGSRSLSASPERSIPPSGRTLGLSHNLGGYPGEMVSFVGVYGTELS